MKSAKYDNENVIAALNDIHNGISISQAARTHGVPRTTLSSKKHGIYPIERKMGPETILTKSEENQLTQWMLHLKDNGFPVTKSQLLDSVHRIITLSKRKTPFTNGRPGRKWLDAFMKRNPIIGEKTAQNLSRARASVTEGGIRNWFAGVQQYLITNNLLDTLKDPARIFNMDESAFYLAPKPGKVLARKSDKVVYSFTQNDDKECLTVLFAGSASGAKPPPMVIYPYIRLPLSVSESLPDEWAAGKSESGWMTAETFYEYIVNIFHPWLIKTGVTLPVLLYIDGHTSHVTYHLSEFCAENGIVLIALHPNSTHIIQPMDVSVFRPLKAEWLKGVTNWRLLNYGAKLKREDFAKLLKEVADKSITIEIIVNGFRKCGLFPFSADAVDYSRIVVTSASTENIAQNEVPSLNVQLPSPQQVLKYVEVNLDHELIEEFKNSHETWNGETKHLSLFNFWKHLSNTSLSSEPNNEDVIVINVPTDNTNNSYTCFIDNDITNEDYDEFVHELQINENVDFELTNQGLHADGPSLNIVQETVTEIEATQKCVTTSQPLQSVILPKTNTTIEVVENQDGSSRQIPIGMSPLFKEALLWPGRPSKKKSSKRKREVLSGVMSGVDMRLTLKMKEEEKLRLEQEKEERKIKRMKRLAEKEVQIQIQNEKRQDKNRERKKKRQKQQKKKALQDEKRKLRQNLLEEKKKIRKQKKNED